ncbi:MAG: hypothetical protein CMK56_04530 [Proteobacteria bacterium]|nr:hypothetical protein [Pseudomonadota bacterium]
MVFSSLNYTGFISKFFGHSKFMACGVIATTSWVSTAVVTLPTVDGSDVWTPQVFEFFPLQINKHCLDDSFAQLI